jgi:hypothetical protein
LVLVLLGAVDLDDVTDSFIGWNAGDPCNASSLFSAGRIRRQAESPDGGRRSSDDFKAYPAATWRASATAFAIAFAVAVRLSRLNRLPLAAD